MGSVHCLMTYSSSSTAPRYISKLHEEIQTFKDRELEKETQIHDRLLLLQQFPQIQSPGFPTISNDPTNTSIDEDETQA
ncbi:unnamed protein product [Arabidopsis lyrata]|uniref:Predicted protein n=1 Tax=Arabidopsis lyrata subsp. lyrata TaxID=81972 RepID=D7L7L2_ARALL|nr:predicted protein [Arabidopsis lyrata subsp. lyrata]CAH8262723.1 unnamed protein product [Arabidopsis lyrata]